MRDVLIALVFFSLLILVFFRGPFFGILIYFWVSLMAPQFIAWGFAARIPYALLAAGTTVVSWLFFSKEPKMPTFDKVTMLLVALMIWISITAWFGTGSKELVYFYWSNDEKLLIMTLLTYTLATTCKRIDQLIAVCALSVAYYGFKGGVWALLHGGQDRVYGGADGSMIGDNNLLGAALATVLPLLLYTRQHYCKPYFKLPMFVLIGLTAIGDLFTYSRGALLALSGMTGIAWLRSRQKCALAILAGGITLGVWMYAPSQWFARMGTIQTYDQDASAQQRLYMWRLSWAMALKHPIVGGGAGWSYNVSHVNEEFAGSEFHWPFAGENEIGSEFSDGDAPTLIRPRAAHSIWFEMLSDQGFPGLLLYVAILLSVAVNARWLIRNSRGHSNLASAEHLGRFLQASLIAYMIGGSFASNAMFDLPYAIVIIAAASRRAVAREIAAKASLASDSAGRQMRLRNRPLIDTLPTGARKASPI